MVRSLLFIGKIKTDPTTRVIVHEKSSLAPPGQSLAFSLGDEKGFRWIGAYDISSEDLLAGGEGSKTELKQEQAAKLIEQFLSEGRKVSIAEINKEAAEQGSDNEECLSAQCVWQEILWEIKSQVSVREKIGGSGLSNKS